MTAKNLLSKYNSETHKHTAIKNISLDNKSKSKSSKKNLFF